MGSNQLLVGWRRAVHWPYLTPQGRPLKISRVIEQ